MSTTEQSDSPSADASAAAAAAAKPHPATLIVSRNKRNPTFSPLTLPALDFSLTKGTDIPSPPVTPPSEESGRQTPTPGGGPLSSHPATPSAPNMPGSFPPGTPTSATELKANRVLGRDPSQEKDSPFQQGAFAGTASATASGRRHSSSSKQKSGMKRLFSFRSFYGNSNASSADCFSGGAGTYDPNKLGTGLGRTSTADSIPQPYRPSSSLASYRPDSPYTARSAASGGQKSPGLRKKRSSAWFGSVGAGKRKSGLFLIGKVDEGAVEDGDDDDDGGRRGEAASGPGNKENREPPPTIHEVRVDTDLGGEELFRDIK